MIKIMMIMDMIIVIMMVYERLWMVTGRSGHPHGPRLKEIQKHSML